MAVTRTGAIFKSLTFDGIDSRDYGVYITGEAVFNAPTRDAEMIVIPGRNGTFLKDNGRYDNRSVIYTAGCFADTEQAFAEQVSDFRNAICSRIGYKRLEDDYNSDEYREAVYKAGLEVTPLMLKAGEFTITFECKPQRFLTSGETAMTVMDGATLTNPTPFPSKPLIQAKGYGMIDLAGQEIAVANSPLGIVQLLDVQPVTTFGSDVINPQKAYSFDGSVLNTGDSLHLYAANFGYVLGGSDSYTAMSVESASAFDYASADLAARRFNLAFYGVDMVKGTPFTRTASANLRYTYAGGETLNVVYCTLAYDGNQTITLSLSQIAPSGTFYANPQVNTTQLEGDSTMNAAGTLYIDCENGVAWWDESGTIVDANGAVSLPADLPELEPGQNVISYDNTFTQMKIAPRWWKL